MTGTDDVKIIESVIQSYLDGLYESDAVKIASVFHPTSALTSVTNDGELVITPRDKWLDKVRARPSPKQEGLPRHDHVLTIDLVSPTMAYVKLKCAIPPRFFTDQLSAEDRWQLANRAKSLRDRDARIICRPMSITIRQMWRNEQLGICKQSTELRW
jgi:Putative lumazine-binding